MKTQSQIKARNRAYSARYRILHRDKIQRYRKAYREKNAKRLYAEWKAWAQSNPTIRLAQYRRWKSRHRDVKREGDRAAEHRAILNLNDSYVRRLITKQYRMAKVPTVLIDCQRTLIKIKRKLSHATTNQH